MTPEQLAAAGFELDSSEYARLSHFVDLLLAENRKVNLTAIRDADAVWRLHVCESLSLLPLIGECDPRRLLDLGTGGGLPGIPLACVCPDLEVVLLDATKKKLAACERMIGELELGNASVLWGRAESLAHQVELREHFDAVTARAVAALPTLVEYAAGFARVGGQCWLSKTGESVEVEIASAHRAAGQCGLRYVRTHRFSLPDDRGERAVVVYEKLARLRADLPRSGGRPRHKPM